MATIATTFAGAAASPTCPNICPYRASCLDAAADEDAELSFQVQTCAWNWGAAAADDEGEELQLNKKNGTLRSVAPTEDYENYQMLKISFIPRVKMK